MKRLLLAVAALLVLGELGLRAFGYQAPLWLRPDPQLGWTLRPGIEGVYSREGRAYVSANPAGFRDRERLLDKPEGVYRIAVLGDSMTEAMQVDVGRTWWRQLPGRLERCGFEPDQAVEVLAFAVTGWGTAQQSIALETQAMRYAPDLVLLQFSNADDVQNNSFALAEEKERPFFLLDAKGRLRPDASFAASPGFRERSRLLHEIGRRVADRSRLAQLALESHARGFTLGMAHAAEVNPALLVPPRDALWEEAWRVTEALIERTRALAERGGARFVLLTAPHPAQLRSPALSYPDERLEAFAKARGIRAFALAPGLAKAQGDLYYGRHWSPDGHSVVADLVAEALCAAR